MRLFRVRRYRRTCRACGHVWDIARALANERMPGRREMAQLAGPRPSLVTGDEAVVVRRRTAVEKLERIDRNSRCPECGGKDFDQRVV